MECLAAIGLAGNVVQFVSFGYSLIAKSSEIHKSVSGASSEHIDLHIISQNIKDLNRKIISNQNSSQNLCDVTERCNAVAEDLLQAIAQLQFKQLPPGPGKGPTKWQSFRKALKSVWTKVRIDELKSRLESLRDQVMMHLVSSTRSVNLVPVLNNPVSYCWQ